MGETGNGDVENPFHLVVIVSWLLVKEGSRLMADMVSQCPLPTLKNGEGEGFTLFSPV